MWYEVPIYAVQASDNPPMGGRSADITPAQVKAWVDRANDVYSAARIKFRFDGKLHQLQNTRVNNLTGESDPQWTEAKNTLNSIAARERRLVAVFRHGPEATPTGGGFSDWRYDFVIMPGFNHTSVCGVQNVGLFAHELGHYLGLPHTFVSYPSQKDAENALSISGSSVFDADSWLIDDTTPEPFIESLQCSGDLIVELNGQHFSLHRDNVMSYYYSASPATLTPTQILRVRRILEHRLDNNILTLRQSGNSNANYVFGWKWDDFIRENDQYWKKGWRLHRVNSYVINGQVRFNAIWQDGSRYSNYVLGWKRADFDREHRRYLDMGWHLTCLDTYVVDGQVRFNAIWFHGNANHNNRINWVYWWKREDFFKENERNWAKGRKLRDISSHVLGKQVFYSATWQEDRCDANYVLGWKSADFFKENERHWKKGWKLRDVDSYVLNGQVYYNAVWDEGNKDSNYVLGWEYDDFDKENARYWREGWRLHCFDAYVLGNKAYFNAVWRK